VGPGSPYSGRNLGYASRADEGLSLPFPFRMHPALLISLQALYASILTYNLANNVVKMSFLLQYRRIFGTSSHIADRVCHWLSIFVAVWAVVQASLLGVSCIPAAAIMSQMIGKCLDTMPVWYFSSSMNILTDLLIFFIPLPCVYRMSLPRSQKALVCSIFCLGFL
jgi:hypothetical protein